MEVNIRNPFSILRRKIAFRFDNYAIFKMCELNGREFHELDELPEQQIVISWIFAAYLSACAEKYRRPRYDFKYIVRVYRWYYVHKYAVVDMWKEAMQSSKVMGKTVAEWAENEDAEKKK